MGIFAQVREKKASIESLTLPSTPITVAEVPVVPTKVEVQEPKTVPTHSSIEQTPHIPNASTEIEAGDDYVIAEMTEQEKNTLASKLYRFYPENYLKDSGKAVTINGNSDISFEDMFSSLLFTLMMSMAHHGISDLHSEVYGDNTYRIQWRKNQSMSPLTRKDLLQTFEEWELHKFGVVREKVFGIFEILGKHELIFNLENYRENHFASREFVTEFITKLTADSNSFNNSYKALSTRIVIRFNEKKYTYRVEIIPTKYDGKVVYNIIVRLLAGKYIKPDYFHYQPIFAENLSGKGILIIGGQTNSGKSTSIVGGLYDLNKMAPDKKYFSIENPIENPLPFATQLEVYIPVDRNMDNTMDFSDFSRSLFRGDGDVIFIGEIRDGETLNNSIKLSLSGHNIFSTIHITSVFDFFNRVVEYGKQPIEALNNTRLVIVQQLEKTYKVETGVRIGDLTEYVSDPIHDALIDFNKTGEVGIIIQNFYGRTKRYEPLIRNNILLGKCEDKRQAILEALKTSTDFAKYLSNMQYYSRKNEKGMRLMFEFLQVNERNKNFILDENKNELFKVEDIFIPMFVNAFLFEKQDFSLLSIFDLSKVVY